MDNQDQKHPLAALHLDSSCYPLLGANALRMGTVGGGVWAVLLNLYILRLGYDALFVGILTGLMQLAVVVVGMMSGLFSRRFEMKHLLIAGVTGLLVASLLLPLGEFMGPARTVWIILMRLLAGASTGIYFSNYHPSVSASAPVQQRRQVFSLDAAMTPFGGFAGSLLGGWLPALFAGIIGTSLDVAAPYRWALLVGAVLYSPALYLALKTKPSYKATTADQLARRKLPVDARGIIGAMVAVSILRMAGENAAKTYLNVYLDTILHTPTATIGMIAAVGQLLAAPAALLTPRITRKNGLVPTVAVGALGVAVGLGVLAVVPSELGAAIGFLFVNASGQIARPAYIVFIQEVLGTQWRQMLSGVTTASANIGSIVASLGGGYLATAVSYSAMFGAGALACASGGILFWAQFRKPRGAYATHDSQTQLSQ